MRSLVPATGGGRRNRRDGNARPPCSPNSTAAGNSTTIDRMADDKNCEACHPPIEGEAVPVYQRQSVRNLGDESVSELIGDVVLYVHPECFNPAEWVRTAE
jgi:hypothetical protein